MKKNNLKVKSVSVSLECTFMSREDFSSIEKYYDFVGVQLTSRRLDASFNSYAVYRKVSSLFASMFFNDDELEEKEYYESLPDNVCIQGLVVR